MSLRPTSRLQLTLLALMGAVGLLTFALGAALETGGRAAEPYTAVFDDAGAILSGSDVKIAGVRAGRVSGLAVKEGQAHVTMTIDRAFLPLHEDAAFAVRPVSLLGERYVDVDPGSASSPPVAHGTVFETSNTSRAVELDDVLNALDDPTATSLATLLTALGGGMAGRGGDTAQLFDRLAPALDDTDELVSILDDQNAVLQQLVDSLSPVTAALGSDRGQRMDDLVGSAAELFAATADRQEALEASIQQLPGTLRSARTSLEQLAGLADRTTQTLHDIRPVTSDLQDIARELEAFALMAEPALASLDPVLAHGNDLVEELRPVAAALRPAGDDLRDVTEDVRPIVDTFVQRRKEFFDFVRNWALTTNASDGVSHYFRAVIMPSPDNVPLPFPGAQTRSSRPTPQDDATSQDDEVVETAVDQLEEGIDDRVDEVIDGRTEPEVPELTDEPDPGSATGLTPDQEQGLLTFLLGGS